ncbi:MAG: MoxR family ATPase [Sphingobacteriales bacterium]|nr:MAG: MoxR family ATPase [Sphingobacteriales bacterium]
MSASIDQTTLSHAHQLISKTKQAITQVVLGQDAVVEQVLIALLARGHVLLEGVPGLGKTLLVRALAKCFGGEFRRIQFTPDLMPSDVTGHALFNMQSQSFEVRKGPVFTHLLLADEINRAPAKTQAALLEVMEEQQVSIEGESLAVPNPFMVLATQNPVEQEGTYPLPEAQLDRFLLKVVIDYPSQEHEELLVKTMGKTRAPLEAIHTFLTPAHIASLQKVCSQIIVDDAVLRYIVQLVRATRQWQGLQRGAGPRAGLGIQAAARAHALINERNFVTPHDVKIVAPAVLRHRISLTADAEIEGFNADDVIRDIVQNTAAPRS